MTAQGHTVGMAALGLTHSESDSRAHVTQHCDKLPPNDETDVYMSYTQSQWFLPPFFVQ